jgi:type II secretory pathway component PulM
MSDQHQLIPDTVESLRTKNAMLTDMAERRDVRARDAEEQCAQLRPALDASQRMNESLTQQIEDLRLQANKENTQCQN